MLNNRGIMVYFFIWTLNCFSSTAQVEGPDNNSVQNLEFTVEKAPEWDALFYRTSGWFGADGIFAVPLNGKENEATGSGSENLLLFSDTVIGEVDGRGSNTPDFVMVNNTMALFEGSEPKEVKITFHWDRTGEGNPKTMFIPNSPSAEEGDYYWLGDGFVNTRLNNTIYIFAYRMRNLDESKEWSFKQVGTNLISFSAESRPPFKDRREIEAPLQLDDGGFGAGIFVNTEEAVAPDPDGYVYVYGVRGKEKSLLVARVLPEEFEDFNAWRFLDGQDWQSDIQKAAPVTRDVSNELSVSALPDGRYALVFQVGGMGSTVGLRIGETPYGPFGPVIKVWECEEGQQKNYITYNAKAHPSLSAPGELLISYNVNAFDFMNEIRANPHLYRPRFIRVKLK